MTSLETIGSSVYSRMPFMGPSAAFFTAADFFVAAGFALFVFPLHIALAGIIVLSIGDSASAVYGIHFGRVQLFGKRTLEGSLTYFFFAYAALLFLLGPDSALFLITPAMAFPAALVATLIELLPKVPDNIVIPVGVGAVLTVMGF